MAELRSAIENPGTRKKPIRCTALAVVLTLEPARNRSTGQPQKPLFPPAFRTTNHETHGASTDPCQRGSKINASSECPQPCCVIPTTAPFPVSRTPSVKDLSNVQEIRVAALSRRKSVRSRAS